MKKLFILGAGGFANEVINLVKDINKKEQIWEIVALIEKKDSPNIGKTIKNIPVMTLDDLQKKYSENELWGIPAIGSPQIKEKVVKEAQEKGYSFATLIHPSVLNDEESLRLGIGTIICAATIISTDIVIGDFVTINLDCTIGHDSIIENFVTISPGCHLSGHTTVRSKGFIGTGVVTIENHTIGENSIVGAGLVVHKDIKPNVKVIGKVNMVELDSTKKLF